MEVHSIGNRENAVSLDSKRESLHGVFSTPAGMALLAIVLLIVSIVTLILTPSPIGVITAPGPMGSTTSVSSPLT